MYPARPGVPGRPGAPLRSDWSWWSRRPGRARWPNLFLKVVIKAVPDHASGHSSGDSKDDDNDSSSRCPLVTR